MISLLSEQHKSERASELDIDERRNPTGQANRGGPSDIRLATGKHWASILDWTDDTLNSQSVRIPKLSPIDSDYGVVRSVCLTVTDPRFLINIIYFKISFIAK